MTPRTTSLTGRILAASVVVAAVLVLAFVPFARSLQQAQEADRADEEAARARTVAAAVLGHVVDAQSAARGYIITGDERFLDPARRARRSLPGERRELRRLVPADAPGGQASSRLTRQAGEFTERFIARL